MATYEDRIREARPGLSRSFITLADFLLDSYAQAAFLTATELAHSLDVDPATVVRFAQRLGYPGYPELQREIRERVKRDLLVMRTQETDSAGAVVDLALEELIRYLDLTRRSFPLETAESLIAALDEAERVIVLGEGLALSPARSLGGWLESAGYTVHLAGEGISDLARALVGARRGDLAIAVEVVEETSLVARALAEARRSRVRTAAIVAAPSLPSTDHADLVLAGHATPEPGMGQVVVEAIVHAFVQLLILSRPGRFREISRKVKALTQKLDGTES